MVIETKTETDSIFNSVTIGNSTTGLDGTEASSLEHIFYNPVTDKVETDRAIETTLNSLFLGKHHKMSSGGENIYFTNLSSDINWYPGWGGVLKQDAKDENGVLINQQPGAGVYKPSMRVFQEYIPLALGGQPNPGTSIPYSGSNTFPFNISGLGVSTMVAETIPSDMVLKYEISIAGTPAYVQYLDNHGGLNPNELLTWFFDHPLDITGTPGNPGLNTVSISKLDTNRNSIGILKVCQGLVPDVDGIRYQTTVLSRKFTDKNIAYKDELENLPIFYEGQNFYDIYINITYDNSFEDSNGTLVKPYITLEAGINASTPGDRIFIIGDCFISSEIILPNHSLSFYGLDGSSIKYTTYNTTNNTNLLKFTGVNNTETIKFKNIEFCFAGEYAINITNAKQVDIIDCTLKFNGWNGTGLSTTSPSTSSSLGYNTSNPGDLQDFYTNTIQSLDGGGIYINNTTIVQIIGNRIQKCYNPIKLINCGINGNGFITRNIIGENIQSGIYLGTDNDTGCENMTVSMNYSSYNANTGISIIGGINNKFSQNEINGNWNAGFYNSRAVNTTFRDCGLYNNNRTIYNGIGEQTVKSKASIVIDEAVSTTPGEISINTDATFIIEVLDTQVHYTGIDTSSNTSIDLGEKTGIYITQNVGNLVDSPKNIIKIDDVGFIGQNYAIDFSDVNVSSLRLSLGDNSYQSIGIKTIKDPLGGMYSELPYSNHVMQVQEVDIKTDLDLKKTIKLCEGQNGHVINVYYVNELESIVVGSKINIIQKKSNKIQLRGLELNKVYINGVLPTANDISSLNDTINATFNMTRDQFESFLISDVGLDGRNTLPVRDNIWKQQFGPQANTIITTNIVTDANKNIQPFRYIPHANLRKGKEYIWTHDDTEDYILGFWNNSNSSTTHNETDVFLPVKWNFAFKFTENLVCNTTDGSVNSDIDTRYINGYPISNYTLLALRYSYDNFVYLLDITNGGNLIIGKANSPPNIRFSFGGGLNSKLPIIRETNTIWDIVHDYSASENKEWIDGINSKTVLRSNMKIFPNQKITLNFDYFGKDETIGMLYNGASFSNSNAPTSLRYYLKYSLTTNVLIDPTNAWIFDTSASNYDSVLEGWGRGASNSLGEISVSYKSDSSIELFSQTENQTIATLRYKLRDPFFQIYFGADTSHTLSEIPVINKFSILNTDIYPYNQTWYYIESPDGIFYYPLFKTSIEARGVDVLLGGDGTYHSHTYVDDPSNTTWYMPTKNSVMNNTDGAPQNGIWNNLTNILWNQISTNPDNQYLPSSYTNQEHTYLEDTQNISIQYKPTDSFSYTLTGLPPGWTQDINTIDGNAEDLSHRGYGNIKTYVVYVTKANTYGSVVGTITINIKPILASNEFQVIEETTSGGVVDDIKLSFNYGITLLNPSSISLYVGNLYKFFLDNDSVESNDVLDIVLESDNSIVYTTGVTNIGTVSNEGAYLQFDIDDDVPPVKLRWTSGTGEVILKNLNINGSTYSPPVTGITHEGPDTLNVSVADSSNWYSIDTQFAKDKRILLTGTLLKEIASELGDINSTATSSSVLIGLKGTSWSNTDNGDGTSGTGFLHEMAIKISRGNVGEYIISMVKDGLAPGATTHNITFTSLVDIETNGSAFIEIIDSGDAFRLAITNDPTNNNILTTTNFAWSNTKRSSGVQGFNITNIDLMIYFDKQDVDFDYDNVDWTQISTIPTPVDLITTNWDKAIDYKGSNQYNILTRAPNTDFAGSGNRSIIFPICMNDFGKLVPDDANNSTKFSNHTNSRPWSLATVFMIDGHNSDQLICGQVEGTGIDQVNIMLKVDPSNDLLFFWGQMVSGSISNYNIYRIVQNMSVNTWYGVYIEHTGCRYNATDSTAANLNKAVHFKLVDITTGVVTDNPGTWTTTGFRISNNVKADFMIGGITTDENLHGKVASCVVTSQLRDADYPVDAEVSMMVRDPVKWLTDYKIGQDFRVPNSANAHSSVFALDDNFSSYSTHVWLMGDTSQDSFPSIKNYVYPASITTPLDMTNMLSTDIETIYVPELN